MGEAHSTKARRSPLIVGRIDNPSHAVSERPVATALIRRIHNPSYVEQHPSALRQIGGRSPPYNNGSASVAFHIHTAPMPAIFSLVSEEWGSSQIVDCQVDTLRTPKRREFGALNPLAMRRL